MGVPKPADETTIGDTVRMEHPFRKEVHAPGWTPEEDPTVIQPVLRPTPTVPHGD